MKLRGHWLGVLCGVIAALSVRADSSVFGNSLASGNAFNLVTYNQLSLSGAAIEFTPLQNIDLSSVTLWLSGYNGQNGQDIDANIWLNGGNAPDAPYISLASPSHNDGSLASFTFSNPVGNSYYDPSDSLELLANVPYWLVVTSGGAPGNYIGAASWADGTAPTGIAAFDGADSYNVYAGSFSSSSDVPAFSINSTSAFLQPVPEPGSTAFACLSFAFGMFWILRRRARQSAVCAQSKAR